MIQVFSDLKTLSKAAAELFVTQSQQALAKGRFSVALSGGNTPTETYEFLGSSPLMDQVPWPIVQFFWGDERWVPPSDMGSNEGMARRTLLNHIPVPDDQIHPMYDHNLGIQQAVQSYEQLLRDVFVGEKYLFDLVYLGLGKNGHTASLFPGTAVLNEQTAWVGRSKDSELGRERMTLTAEAINRSALIVFLVSGAEKAEILQQVLEGPFQPEQWPAQLIRPSQGKILWFVDKLAAQNLSPSTLQRKDLVRS